MVPASSKEVLAMITSKRLFWLMPLLLMAVLLLAACGDAPTQVAEQEGGFLLALPRVTIDVNEEGVPSVAGLSPDMLKAITFGQVDLSGVRIPQEYIDWFSRTNMQHVELVHKDDGLFFFVNGLPMPHVGWSGDSLSSMSETAGALGLLDERTAKLLSIFLPFAQRMGIDIAVRFPRAAGAEEIALRDPKVPIPEAPSGDEAAMAKIRAQLKYDDKGVPSILSVSTREMQQAFGLDMRSMELPAESVAMMTDRGIQHVTVRSLPNGLFVGVNDAELPGFVWSDEFLGNASELYGQLYYTAEYEQVRQAVAQLLPLLNRVDAEVVLLFPVEDGANAIPIPNP
jgi:hypothetical protein